MDALTIALITATTALISAVVGPLMTFIMSARQIRASVISSNRERWLEALRDSLAEYVGLLLTAALMKQTQQDAVKVVSADPDLRQIVERIVVVKNKIMLLSNPTDGRGAQLCEIVEKSYLSLASDSHEAMTTVRSEAEAITRAGRDVLRAEWARVKRGD